MSEKKKSYLEQLQDFRESGDETAQIKINEYFFGKKKKGEHRKNKRQRRNLEENDYSNIRD